MLHQWLTSGCSRLKITFIVIRLFKISFLQLSVKSAGQVIEKIQNPDDHTHSVSLNQLFSVEKKVIGFILWSLLEHFEDVTSILSQENFFPSAGNLCSWLCSLLLL